MKTTGQLILRIVVGFALLIIGFGIGGVYSGRVASYASHISAVSLLTAIDMSLARQDIERARERTAFAINAHVGALYLLEAKPSTAFVYVAPWMTTCYGPSINQKILTNTHRYFEKHQERLSPETRAFLARHASTNATP